MGMPKKGSRRLVVSGVAYSWVTRYEARHWAKGSVSTVRVVFEAEADPGQRLVATFVGRGRDPDDPLREPFAPSVARRLIEAGLARGWRPDLWGLPAVELGQDEVPAAAAVDSPQS